VLSAEPPRVVQHEAMSGFLRGKPGVCKWAVWVSKVTLLLDSVHPPWQWWRWMDRAGTGAASWWLLRKEN
jgi:hypothetical protein